MACGAVARKAGPVLSDVQRGRFERLMLPHMDAAFNLARWLVRDSTQAEEAVQEAFLKAFRYFHTFRGDDARPWLLGIVRNACYEQMQAERRSAAVSFDEDLHGDATALPGAVLRLPVDPEAALIARADRDAVQGCLRDLPPQYREAIVLRELHGCSYREISQIADIPLGTVMSRLARGRKLLQRALAARLPRRNTGT